MKKYLLALIALNFLTNLAYAASLDSVFKFVLEKKGFSLRSEVPFPTIYFESKTPLRQFQDALEKQWGQRPESFTNAFAIENNELYIIDDPLYYERHKRCIDDSIAHELTHYVQSKYQGWDLNDDSLEWQAINIQTQYRNKFCVDSFRSKIP